MSRPLQKLKYTKGPSLCLLMIVFLSLKRFATSLSHPKHSYDPIFRGGNLNDNADTSTEENTDTDSDSTSSVIDIQSENYLETQTNERDDLKTKNKNADAEDTTERKDFDQNVNEKGLETSRLPIEDVERDSITTEITEIESKEMGIDSESKAASDASKAVPVRIPNPIFQMLLRQGRIGHTIVTSLLMTTEWIEVWIRPLGHLLTLLFTFFFPVRMARDRKPRSKRESENGLSLGSRTGISGKQRRKLVRKADEAALRQLQQLGSLEDAKYKYVSQSFLERHGLGRFGSSSLPFMETKSMKDQTSKDEDSTDWVVSALTSEPQTDKKKKKFSVKPSISVSLGSRGPDVSVGIEIGQEAVDRKSAIVKAATSRKRKSSPSKVGPRASDSQGGDGIFGHLRNISGANSQVSRTLFGAYPGDAPSIEEAASRDGLRDLAEKYGYGEWSEPEDEFGFPRAQSYSRRRKRRRRKSSSLNISGGSVLGERKIPTSRDITRSKAPLSGSRVLSSRSHRRDDTFNRSSMPLLSRASAASSRKSVPNVCDPAMNKLDVIRRKKLERNEED